jgi:integrase
MRKAFAESAAAYLEAIEPYYAKGTRARILRNLRTVEDDLKNIEEPYGLATAPTRIGEEHIAKLLLVWQGRGLNPATQKKYLQDLNGMLTWFGRPVLAQMRKNPAVKRGLPQALEPDPESLDEEDLAQLRAAAEAMDGWRGAVARLLIELMPASGLRPKEVLGVRLADVNLHRGRIQVTNPKGKGKYANESRYVPLPAAAQGALADFLSARKAYLGDEPCEWLLPLRRNVPVLGPDGQQVGRTKVEVHGRMRARGEGVWMTVVGPWTDTVLRKLAADLRERTGVRFSWKTMRSTFGQRLVDRGVPLEQTSLAMRHKKIETTRRYYVHLDQERALMAARRALDGPVRGEGLTQ